MRQRVLAVFAVVCSLCLSPAAAQQAGERWSNGDGAFTVTVPEGWTRIDPPRGAVHILAGFGPPRELATRENPQLPICSVEGRPLAEVRTQTQINAMLQQMREPLLQALRPTTVHSSSVEEIAGVSVLTVDIDRAGVHGPTRQIQRMFGLPTPTGFVHYQVGCGASGSAFYNTDFSVLHGFVASLTIATEAATQ